MASVQKRLDCANFLSVYNPNFLCLSQTWLETTDNILPDCGYTVISQNNRHNGIHGGVAIMYKTCSQYSAYDFTSADYDFACGCIINSDPPLLVVTIYNPPVSSEYRIQSNVLNSCTLSYTSRFAARHPDEFICICGDFISSDICWMSYTACSDYSNLIIDLFEQFNGVQLVENTTHFNGNILTFLLLTVQIFALYLSFPKFFVRIIIQFLSTFTLITTNKYPVPAKFPFTLKAVLVFLILTLV